MYRLLNAVDLVSLKELGSILIDVSRYKPINDNILKLTKETVDLGAAERLILSFKFAHDRNELLQILIADLNINVQEASSVLLRPKLLNELLEAVR